MRASWILASLLTSLTLGLAACEASLVATDQPPQGEPGQQPPGSPMDPTMPGFPPHVTPKDPQVDVLPDVPPLKRPDGLPIPGTDTCRPPRQKLWQLTPLQQAQTYQRLADAMSVGDLQARLELYAAQGSPYSADPSIINGSTLLLTELFGGARRLAAALVAKPESLDACLKGTSQPSDACLTSALSALALKALRRPLDPASRDAWLAAYKAHRASLEHDAALELTLRRVLMAPGALTRAELGVVDDSTGLATLSAFERADLIAYTLTDAPPDEALMAAALDGSLQDPGVMRRHAQRLLDAQPSRESVITETIGAARQVVGLMRFFREWLDTNAVTNAERPELNRLENLTEERVLRWLDNEAMMFLRHVLWDGDGKLSTLLSADFSALKSNTLARYYGIAPVPTDEVSPAAHGRLGLLMQAGFLTAHKSTTARGLFIRERLLCQIVPAAPLEADMNLEGLADDLAATEGRRLSPREVRARHMADAQCSGCHTLIDPLGFPLDGFDTSGRPRAMWDGFPIDTAGQIFGSATIDGPVATPQELIRRLAAAPEVHDCFVLQLYRYVHGRSPTQEDTCYLERLQQSFRASGGDVRALLVDMVTGPEAYERTPLWD